MYTYELDACGDKHFIFEFSFENRLGMACNEPNAHYVSYRLLRKDKPKKVFQWEGCLYTDRIETYKLSYPDEIDIEGSMQLFQNEKENFIWIDVWYCQNLEEHFEGNILEIPGHHEPPLPPIDPPDNPIDPLPNRDISEQELILPAGYNDLFPYLYVRRWPDLTPTEEDYFVVFKNDKEANTLYNTFLSNFNGNKPKPGAREAIIKETFDFINGKTQYPEKYIPDTKKLKFPYKAFPLLYDIIQESSFTNKEKLKDFILVELDMDKKAMEKLIDSKEYKKTKDRVWQNVFALSVLGFYNVNTLQNEIKILLICNLLEALFSASYRPPLIISHLLKASVVLPVPVFPLPLVNDAHLESLEKERAVIPYAIGDLHMTQHKLIGYQTGEIAHIENVLSGEIKERSNFSSNEITEASVYEHKMTTGQDQLLEGSLEGLVSVIKNTLKGDDKYVDNYDKLETSYGPPTTMTLNGEVTNTRTPDLKEDTKLTDFAKKVLNKALARMSQNIKQVFAKQQVNKTEESVVHTLDNSDNEHNVRGIYNWVNKVYSTRVIDYGNRFLLEFLIDNPFPKLASYVSLIEKGLIPPANRKDPITSFKCITRDNYIALTSEYGVFDVPLPPEEYISSFVFFNVDNVLTGQMMPIEQGYVPCNAEVRYSIDEEMELLVGATIIPLDKGKQKESHKLQSGATPKMDKPDKGNTPLSITNTKVSAVCKGAISTNTGTIPVVLTHMTPYKGPKVAPFYISVAVESQPSAKLMNEWRVNVYDAIIKAYHTNVAQNKQAINRLENKNNARKKELLNQLIKGACKELLYTIYLEKNTAETMEGVFADDDLFIEANEPEYGQFFEQAMEWDESTYEFYNAENPFSTNLINDSIEEFIADRSFLDYLDQKKLRVMIPVTPNFNYKMLYYLSTGFISYLQNLITPVVVEDKTIAVALKEVSERNHMPCVHNEPWEIQVPTNMQWLQDKGELPFGTANEQID